MQDETVGADLTVLRNAGLLAKIFAPYHIVSVYLYGSAAQEKMTALSDVDIALVVSEPEYVPQERLNLELEIEDKIAIELGVRRADVRIINQAPLLVKGEVLTTGILLYSGDEEGRVNFETRTLMEYFDFLPVAEMIIDARLGIQRDS